MKRHDLQALLNRAAAVVEDQRSETADDKQHLVEQLRAAADNQMTEREPKYPIGTRFKTRGKHPHICTVTDILKTYNRAGDLVRLRYVATHELGAQTITDSDVVETTIGIGFQTYGANKQWREEETDA